jgi:hypothetical protein
VWWSFRVRYLVKDWHFPSKLSKNGPENSKRIAPSEPLGWGARARQVPAFKLEMIQYYSLMDIAASVLAFTN